MQHHLIDAYVKKTLKSREMFLFKSKIKIIPSIFIRIINFQQIIKRLSSFKMYHEIIDVFQQAPNLRWSLK